MSGDHFGASFRWLHQYQYADISMGIPAVTLGRGGKEGGVHSLGEWFDPEGTYRCPQKSFLMLLALAGVEGVPQFI